jgi:hypothetical protein
MEGSGSSSLANMDETGSSSLGRISQFSLIYRCFSMENLAEMCKFFVLLCFTQGKLGFTCEFRELLSLFEPPGSGLNC